MILFIWLKQKFYETIFTLSHVMHSGTLYAILSPKKNNDGHNVWNWFLNPLMGCDQQFEWKTLIWTIML